MKRFEIDVHVGSCTTNTCRAISESSSPVQSSSETTPVNDISVVLGVMEIDRTRYGDSFDKNVCVAGAARGHAPTTGVRQERPQTHTRTKTGREKR
jgi:hypothetical protein